MIDWSKVQDLVEDIGREGLDEVVDLFLQEVETALQTLAMAEDLEAAMHFVKGCALNLGFAEFAALCAQGERLAATGQPDAVDFAGLARCYADSRRIFLAEFRDRIAA